MKSAFSAIGAFLFAGTLAIAAEKPAPTVTVSTMFDKQLSSAEREIVSLAEAMPADKYSFAPTQGEFKGVRTFGQQVKHVATTNFLMASTILGEKPPVDLGKGEDGPASIQSKDDLVKFLKDSFAMCHKAEATLTKDNLTDLVDMGEGQKGARGYFANIPIWHSFDHYGQMVEYARMNGIIPPASRPEK